MILNTNKTFGNMYDLSDVDLNYLEILFSGVNGASRVIWGLLLDKYSFKMLYSILLLLQVRNYD